MMMIGVGSAVDDSMVGLENGNINGEINLADSGNDILGASGNSWYVKAGATGGDGSEASPYGNLKVAYNHANAGDTIYIMNGTYTGTNNLMIEFTKENLQLSAYDNSNPIFDGQKTNRIFDVSAKGMMISGLTFINAVSKDAFGVQGSVLDIYSPNVVIDNCTFKDNIAAGSGTAYQRGGAIYVYNSGSNAVIKNSKFINNTANNDGGAIFIATDTPNTKILNCEFIDNTAIRSAGGIANWGLNTVIDNCNFKGSKSNSTSTVYTGGSIFSVYKVNVTNSKFANDYSKALGGSIYIYSYGDGSLVENCTFDGGKSSNGGAIATSASTTIKNNNFNYCEGYNMAGAILLMSSNNNVDSNTFRGNSARHGGAIVIYEGSSNNNITNSKFNDNHVYASNGDNGGAVYSYGSNTLYENNTFHHNVAEEYGGAIFELVNAANTTINNCTFTANYAQADAGNGGAYFSASENNTIINSKFENNWAKANGAAIFIRKNNALIENSSFSKNLAARGGAIYIGTIEGKSPINYTINNCTFDQNGVNESKGGAIYSWADELNITNSNFTKNMAMAGGAILFEKGPNFLENCTFDGNKATRYGGGAISSTRHGEIINNCTFRNNDAQGYGGAVSLDYPVITNSLFVNNSANHGGAICTITANVSNSEFYNNTAIDHWVVLAATKLIEYNNTHPGQVALSMNHTNYVNIEYDQDKEIGYAPGYYVYCVEEWADYPQYGVMWEDLRYAQSSLTEEAVGQYLKILIYKYWVNESGHDNFQKLINIFSDEDFRKSDNEIVKDVIALYDNGYRVPSHNAIKVDDNGTVILYNFREIITPSATQNVFAFNLSYNPNATVVKELVNKSDIFINSTVDFNITVKNNCDFNLTYLIINETDFSEGLIYKSFKSDFNWTYDNVTKVWTLEDDLAPNKTANIILTFNVTKNGKMNNTVSLLIGNYTLDNSTVNFTVYAPNLTVKKLALNKTVYIGNQTVFTIIVENTGDYNLTNVTVVEKIPTGLKFASFKGDGWTTTDNVTFKYQKTLNVDGKATLNITFDAIEAGNWTNIVTASSNVTGNRTAENNTTVYRPDLKVEKIALNKTVYLGNQTVFTIVVTNTGDCDLGNVSVVENIPVGLKYSSFVGDGWSTVDNVTFVYSGVLKANESASFDIVFDTLAAGNWTNIVTASSNVTENRTANNNTTVYRPDLKVEKITLNKTVYLGNQTIFTIVVTNIGDCELGNIEVTEEIPNGLKYNDYYGNNWEKVDDYKFKYGDVLKVGESVIINIIFDTVEAGNWTNIVSASSNLTKDKTANNTTSVYSPDMTVVKLANNDVVYMGNQTSFTIIVKNTGNCKLGDIYVDEIMPEGLVYDSYVGKNWSKVENRFIYNGDLNPGEEISFTVFFNTTRSGNFTNVVTASSNLTKDKKANNTTRVYTPNMVVSKIALNPIVYTGDKTSFMITVRNTGDCDLSNIEVVESIPEGLIYDSFTGNGWIKETNKFIYNGILKPGETKDFVITFNTIKSGNFTNIVAVSSNLIKNKMSNNTTTVYTPSLKVEKITLNECVYVGNQTSFSIIVTNTGDCKLGDVFVFESSYDGLVYDSYYGDGWIKEGNKFIYMYDLDVGESAGFIIVFNTTKSGNFTNIVIAGSNLTGNITTQNNTEVIQNHTENKTIINNTTDKKTFIKQDIGLATGNPLLILLIALLTCVIPFRKQKK